MGRRNALSAILSIRKLSEMIKSGEVSPSELIELSLNRIEELNPVLHSFITVIKREELLTQACIAEKEIKRGNYRGPLHGIPFSVKDNIYVKDIRCTCGSKILSSYIPNSSATVFKRMKKAGAIFIGTNNLNEFASGISGINPFYGSSKNPWDITRLSGGSSGGSAVAVATGMVLVSLGTDTGGSVRVPASLCGVVGLKPTYGRVSRHNIFPLSPTLDHVGCITRGVWDAAAVLEYIAGWDPLDGTSIDAGVPRYTITVQKSNLDGRRIGVLEEYFFDCLHPEVSMLFERFMGFLRSNKVTVVSGLKLHDSEEFYSSWLNIRLVEAANVHLRWLDTRAEEYSDEVRRMLMERTQISEVDVSRSLRTVKELRKDFITMFSTQKLDALTVPTTIIPAPQFGQYVASGVEIRQALLRNSIVFNSTGLPSITVPIGLAKQQLPVGAQLIGPPFEEEKILSIAYCIERIISSKDKFVPNLDYLHK
jgi:aspartyl-tRNA(Asn)/glutamyl-tRNA(Gln) amidotransferase subunit A